MTDTAQMLAKLLVITTADRSKAEQPHVKEAAKPAVKRQRKQSHPVLALAG